MSGGRAPAVDRLAAAGRLVVVGPGRLGLSLAAALHAAAAAREVEVRGRTPREPESGPDAGGAGRPGARPPFLRSRPGIAFARGVGELPGPGGCLLFAVPDDALAEACRAWAAAGGGGPTAGRADPAAGPGPAGEAAAGPAPPPPVALHTSGVHPSSVLAPLRDLGFAAASWHPLAAVARPDPEAVHGRAWGVEGDRAARERAAAFTRSLEGRILPVRAGGHARYHAAAVFASNFLVACLGVAREELAAALEAPGEARAEDLLPLARAALDAVERDGLAAGLTGPVARGDAGTVRAHLAALEPARRALYRGLARELLGLAAPGLGDERTAALEAALEEEGAAPAAGGRERAREGEDP